MPADITLQIAAGTRFSLFPFASVQGVSKGLKWPIDKLNFAPNGRIGTSNQTIGESVSLKMHGSGMIAILPRSCLAATIFALQKL